MSKFNEDYYSVSVREWEAERVPSTLFVARWTWGISVAVAASATGAALKIEGWIPWVALGLVSLVVVNLFVFLHEVNENVRYVRHQLSSHRKALETTADEFRKYNHPERVTPFDVIDTLDRKW